MNKLPPKWTPPEPATTPDGATLPTTPLGKGLRYRTSAKTEVRVTIEAERKRLGLLTGEQIRAARRKAEREPPNAVVVAIDRKAAR